MRHRAILGTASALLVATLSGSCSSEPEVATACEGQTLKIGESTELSLIYAPLYVAEQKGFLDDENVKVQHVQLGGGSEAIQALIGGSVDLVATPFTSVAAAKAEGAPLVAFASFSNRYTSDVGIKADKAPADDADWQTKIKALEGLKVGITSPGSGTDQTLRFLARKAGLDPDEDMTIVATGGSSETVAAFSRGSIDAYLIGAPASDVAAAQGDGTMMLRLAEGTVPDLSDILYGVVATSERGLKNKAPLLECYARALSKADALIKKDPDAAGDLLRDDFPDLSDENFKSAWDATVASTPSSAALLPEEVEKAGAVLEVVEPDDSAVVKDAYTEQFNDSLD